MGHVNALRLEFAGHALREPAQGELAHREGRRLRIALHARGRSGEEDHAFAFRQHPAGSLLRHQEAAECRHRQCLFDLRGNEFGEGPAGPIARVVDDGVRVAERCGYIGIEPRDRIGFGGVTGKGLRAGLLCK